MFKLQTVHLLNELQKIFMYTSNHYGYERSRILRIFDILHILAAQQIIKGEHLANELNVSTRTIRTDLKELAALLSEHGATIKSLKGAGSNCLGYMLWAFTDNVSPMNAFKNRYGLVEINLENNRSRHLKKSGYWYQTTIKERSFVVNLDEENK
jgi:predicted transcriptional regulator